MNTSEELKKLYGYLNELEHYFNAVAVIDFDLMTVSPQKAYDYQSETANFINGLAFAITKKPEYIDLVKHLHDHKDELHPYDQRLVTKLNEEIQKEENVSAELFAEALQINSAAYSSWLEAKKKKDYQIFAPLFAKNIAMTQKLIDLRPTKKKTYYDTLISDFEEGFGIAEYDRFFNTLKDHLIPLLKKVKESKRVIRTDFLSRPVAVEKQEKFSRFLMDLIGFDSECGCLSTTEHPFTNSLARYDTRITTHYFETDFISNMYSVIHEGGHAIFGQNEPDEIYDHHLQNHMTMAMHESVSRFYENRLARSREFIGFLYPKLREFFSEELCDVSEEELYLGINAVTNEPLRTDSDELSYCLHIVIRYELEKEFINIPRVDISQLNQKWNSLYQKYLGITPRDDKEGILQDVHWTDSYGYFPTYALGNAYNAMYLNTMKKDIPVFELVARGEFKPIKDWMTEHVFKKASLLSPQDWIKDITGRNLDPQDFIEYLEEKYESIYTE